MKPVLALILSLLFAPALAAHPHIFVDTGLDLHFDDKGQLVGVRVIWTYDEFYSLLIMEDRGLDPDFDGVLTAEEQANLTGFDMQWTEGFNGDLVILENDQELTLSGPQEATAIYENARITTTHYRSVAPAQPSGTIAVKPYDATYYSAYDLTLPIRVLGTDKCSHRIEMPDIDARLLEMRDMLNALDATQTPEDAGLPDIGILLASTVHLTCDMS